MSVYRSSPPCPWHHPRPHRDPSLRLKKHGRVQPMQYDEPGLLRRAGGAVMRLLKAEGRL